MQEAKEGTVRFSAEVHFVPMQIMHECSYIIARTLTLSPSLSLYIYIHDVSYVYVNKRKINPRPEAMDICDASGVILEDDHRFTAAQAQVNCCIN